MHKIEVESLEIKYCNLINTEEMKVKNKTKVRQVNSKNKGARVSKLSTCKKEKKFIANIKRSRNYYNRKSVRQNYMQMDIIKKRKKKGNKIKGTISRLHKSAGEKNECRHKQAERIIIQLKLIRRRRRTAKASEGRIEKPLEGKKENGSKWIIIKVIRKITVTEYAKERSLKAARMNDRMKPREGRNAELIKKGLMSKVTVNGKKEPIREKDKDRCSNECIRNELNGNDRNKIGTITYIRLRKNSFDLVAILRAR